MDLDLWLKTQPGRGLGIPCSIAEERAFAAGDGSSGDSEGGSDH